MKILILCTGNSCRSQMAEGFLKSFDSSLDVYSAGTKPAGQISSKAVLVMREKGIDISEGIPENVEKYINDSFDFVVTVCDNAKESCPVFTGNVRKRLHIGFEDPAGATGTDEEILGIYRRVRDEIEQAFTDFYNSKIYPDKIKIR
jgi:arsenate reductase